MDHALIHDLTLDTHEYPLYKTTELSSYFQERIVFLFFNLTRKQDSFLIHTLSKEFRQVLLLLKKELIRNRHDSQGCDDSLFRYIYEFDLLYRLIAHTRDIVHGKGEHELFYMMIYELYRVFPTLAVYFLHHYIGCGIGCWRDMKYMCQYVLEYSPCTPGPQDNFIDLCVELMNKQLKKDVDTVSLSSSGSMSYRFSTVSKWIPREKTRFSWLFEKLVVHWSATYGRWKLGPGLGPSPGHGPSHGPGLGPSYSSALLKCKTHYRKLLSKLNKTLDTTEIKLCSQSTNSIDIQTVSKYTIINQPKLSTLEEKHYLSGLSNQYSNTIVEQRICSGSTVPYLIVPTVPYPIVPTVPYPISYFVKEAIRLLTSDSINIVAKLILNHKWKVFTESYSSYNFDSILPMLDLSYQMLETDAEAFYTGLGLSILIAEHSSFGKRILTVENKPTWICLDGCDGFLFTVEILLERIRSQSNTGFCFKGSIDFLLKGFGPGLGPDLRSESTLLHSTSVKLVLFSIRCTGECMDDFYDYLETQSTALGLRHHCIKMFFWNLSKTKIMDNLSEKVLVHCVLVSGFSSCLLKKISTCKKKSTSFDFIVSVLLHKRYDLFSQYLHKQFCLE